MIFIRNFVSKQQPNQTLSHRLSSRFEYKLLKIFNRQPMKPMHFSKSILEVKLIWAVTGLILLCTYLFGSPQSSTSMLSLKYCKISRFLTIFLSNNALIL